MAAASERLTSDMSLSAILEHVAQTPGYFLTNNERDVSQSDFKCRILPHTTLKVSPYRDEAGFFAFEISGGAAVHMDLMYKQIDPLEKLRLVKRSMPRTMLQVCCRGRNLFGYRPYPDNVQRHVVRRFARYVDVWRVYDFLNHIPNMRVVGEEVQKQGKLLMPSLCFNTGENHTDAFYLAKVKEILDTFGRNIILSLKNHSAVGTPKRIEELFRAIRTRFPDLILAYHGHNTDGNDLARMIGAVEGGAKIVEAADHGWGGVYSQAPALSLIQILNEYGYHAAGIKVQPLLDASDQIRKERRHYERFETPFKAFDPTVKRHKLTGGAASIAFEQAEKLGLLERIHEVTEELAVINREFGEIWSVTPGSQILWATAVNNVLYGRFEQPTDDLKRLLLGRYGPFPFHRPPDWIMEKVLEHRRRDGKPWDRILEEEGGMWSPQDVDLDQKSQELEKALGRSATEDELSLYLQFPRDAVGYFRFRETYGKTWLLPPDVWFKQGGFEDGTRVTVFDEYGKTHYLDFISTREEQGVVKTSMLVDHHFQTFTHSTE